MVNSTEGTITMRALPRCAENKSDKNGWWRCKKKTTLLLLGGKATFNTDPGCQGSFVTLKEFIIVILI
jgi:hypothetical protein